MKKIISPFLSFLLVFSFFISTFSQSVSAQTAQTQTSSDLQNRLAKIEEKVEARRKELGIPGMSLAIVKDGKVVLSKGFGYKNFEKQIPVTADTQFAIGSATKAFTALSVLMSQDENKLSLDENPRKYIPYFKINDAEINEKITVRNLLTHSSGLNRTDLGWYTGKLSREEIIKVAGEAKPIGKLGEKFLYQNVMYLTAGEIVSTVQKTPWGKFVEDKIFAPLGMTNSTMSIPTMQKAKDFSLGYDYNFDTKQTINKPTREISEIAPAGAINSSANDMTKWLKFILNKGAIGDKRLVSEKGFTEWITPQQKISPDGKFSYALGWFVQEYKGKKVIQHGGNIDGFNSMVAFLPDENLGFVMLTNVSGSSLGGELISIITDGILSENKADSETKTASTEESKEVGKYTFAAAGFDIEIKIVDGKLVAIVPNQPVYTLEKIEGNRYKLSGAPEGFFATFKDDSLYLEQPQGNFTLPRAGAKSTSSESAKELIGKYEVQQSKGNYIEIKDVDGKTSLVVGDQPPYPLIEKEKDLFGSNLLPDSYRIKVKRTAENKVEGITLIQPEGEFPFTLVTDAKTAEVPKITVDELMSKTIEALGGEANWRKLNSRVTEFEMDFVSQGLKGKGEGYAKAPNWNFSKIEITALGKNIATIQEYFDGTHGGEKATFSEAETYTGQKLEDAKYNANFYGILDWKKDNTKAEITGMQKVGDEETYVVKIKPEKANATTYYISTKTFLPVKQISVIVSSTSAQKTPYSTTMSDYRKVDGVMIPFKTVAENPGMGETVTYIKSIKHNVKIDDKKFKP